MRTISPALAFSGILPYLVEFSIVCSPLTFLTNTALALINSPVALAVSMVVSEE